ncbi:uncharacterized protein FFNC_03554 [Fusarium fujikuroi]|nr:uncharacterized protein FFNC_03554 [Fusarium fujikuroi]
MWPYTILVILRKIFKIAYNEELRGAMRCYEVLRDLYIYLLQI